MLISAVLLIGFIGVAILMGGPLEHFLDIPSLTLVFGCVICGAFWSFPVKTVYDAFQDAFVGTENEERAIQGYIVFSKMADVSVASGLLGTLIGLVNMLAQLDDPTAIGPAMAVALLTLFYGVFLGEFFFRSMASNSLSQRDIILERQMRRGFSSVYLAMIALGFLLTTFFVMLIAMM